MDDQPALPRPTVNPWVVLVVGSLSAFMVFLDAQVLFVAFDDIRSSFPSVSFATMSWTLSAYTIALAAALVPAGRMADRYGRRRVFLIGLVAFTLASVLCAVAPSAGLLVAFRVIQALGAAALVPASLALVLSVFHCADPDPASGGDKIEVAGRAGFIAHRLTSFHESARDPRLGMDRQGIAITRQP